MVTKLLCSFACYIIKPMDTNMNTFAKVLIKLIATCCHDSIFHKKSNCQISVEKKCRGYIHKWGNGIQDCFARQQRAINLQPPSER